MYSLSRHGEGAGGQARKARYHDGLGRGGAARDARHQGDVGDQPVHRTEDGGAQPAAVHIAVRVVVAVRYVRYGSRIEDSHALGYPSSPRARPGAAPFSGFEGTHDCR
ncbi:hypothetical protein GCM10020000_60660 [Streptomyces olivoverticillatus]